MKKILFLAFILISIQSFGQIKITDMTTLTSDPANGWVPIVKGGLNYKVDAINIGRDSVAVSSGPSADTLKWYRFGTFAFYKLITRGTAVSSSTDTTFSKPLIGDIYYDTSWTNLTDFVDTSLASISGGKIVMAQDATFSTSIKLAQKTMLDDDSIQVRVVWNTQATNNYGPFLTWTSTNTTVTTASVFGGLNLYPSGADYGKLQITDNYTGTTYTQSTAALSTTAVGDTLTITFANRKGVFALTVENETKGITSTFTVTNSFTYGGQAIGHNTGRVGFKQHNGSYTILSFKHASKQTFRPAKLFVGDSKAAGSYAGSSDARYSELQGGENSAGGGDKTAEVISRLTEISEVIKPQTLYLEIGANDRFQGVSVSTIMTNIDSIVRYCEARGIAVRPMCPAPNNSTSMLALKDSIIARYPTKYIDLYTPMLGTGSNLAAAYNAGDGVHLNAAGNLKIDSLINSSGRTYINNAYVDTYIPGDGITFTKEQSGNYRTFKISATGQVSTTSAAVDSTTVPLITFSAGAGFASDTSMVTDSSLFGSFYTGQYQYTIKAIQAVIKGNSGDSVVIKIVYNDTFNVDGTKISNGNFYLNNRHTGNSFTVSANRTVPVNSWIWVKPEAVIAGKKPKYISITLLGYKTYVAP